jgi:two-component system, chemotaxis family, chemotaxis protein CheY
VHSLNGLTEKNFSHRFLVIDDQPDARVIVQSVLMSLGFYNIHLVGDGQEALEFLSHKKVDFIISDWNMPTLDGLEFLKSVRQMSEYKKVPFLMLTSEAYKENVMQASQAGVTDYICKPFTTKFLAARIKEIFNLCYGQNLI